MGTDSADVWRKCFAQWPDDVPRRGVVVTSFGEQIPFDSFAASGDMLLVERRTPDTVGGRIVLIAYHHIEGLKIVDVVKMKAFQTMGFAVPTRK